MYSLRPLRRGRMLPRFADDFFRDFWDVPQVAGQGFRVDIKDTEKHYLIEAELPGMEKSNIDLELVNGYLTIMVKSDETVKHEEENRFIRRERRMSSCRRQFYVGDVKPEEVQASYENGILKITVPKSEQESGNRRIEIN